MKLPIVKKEKLQQALKRFDEKFRNKPEWKDWTNNQAHRYAVSANDRLYPAKKIVSLATGTPVGLFSGGQPTNGYLKRHGFLGQRYIGEFSYANHEWCTGKDKHGNERQLVVFNLVPVGLELSLEDFDYEEDEVVSDVSSLEEARELALLAAEAGSVGEKGFALRTVYYRSKRIANYVLKRAGGICESCGKPAPFMKKNGSPYLEPHHVNRVSDGGLDHPRFIGAICPDCHREIHHGLNGEAKNDTLKNYVANIER